jgi:hypothetical protein
MITPNLEVADRTRLRMVANWYRHVPGLIAFPQGPRTSNWSGIRSRLAWLRASDPARATACNTPHWTHCRCGQSAPVPNSSAWTPSRSSQAAVVRASAPSIDSGRRPICWDGRRNAARCRSIPFRRRWIYPNSHPNNCVPTRPAVPRCVSPTQ